MNPLLDTLFALRTIHGNFSKQEIPAQDVQTILDASVRAANASNRQSYSIVVVDDPQVIQTICGYRGSRALLFCVDFNRVIDLAAHLGYSYRPDLTVDYVTGSVDAILAAQTAAIAAKALGIDSLFTNGIHRHDLRVLYDTLGLPEQYCFPLILLVLGYPAAEPETQKGRATAGIVHHRQYRRLSNEELDQTVALYDDTQNHLGLSESWQAQGFDHYFDWFFQAWSKGGDDRRGQQVAEFLGRSGFLPIRQEERSTSNQSF